MADEEHWTVREVERIGASRMLEPDDDVRILPGTADAGPVTVKISRLPLDLKGICVRRGQFNWVQAHGQDGGCRYVLNAFLHGELSLSPLEGFLTRIKEMAHPPVDEPQDTETWTAMKPPHGEDGSGRE